MGRSRIKSNTRTTSGVPPQQDQVEIGDADLVLDPNPASIGGHLGGWFIFVEQPGDDVDFDVQVTCYRRKKGQGMSTHDIWTIDGEPQWVAGKPRLAFRFDVPADLPATSVKKDTTQYFWQAVLEGRRHGQSVFRHSYTVPVRQGIRKSVAIQFDSAAPKVEERKDKADEAIGRIKAGDYRSASLQVSKSETGDLVLYFPSNKDRTGTAMMAFFTAFFAGIAYACSQLSTILGVIVALPALYFFFYFLDALFKNLRVEISTGLFVVHTRWAVLPLSSKKVGKGKLKSIELEWAETTGNVRSHKIRANLKNGSKVYLTHLIEGDEYANALLGLVRSTIDGGK